MGVAGSVKLLAAGAAWRIAGLDAAGRTLVDAAADDAESEQMLAGMLLVKAGNRSVPLVANALSAGVTSLELVDVLASIGTTYARDALGDLAASAEGEVAAAAADAIRTLDEMNHGGP